MATVPVGLVRRVGPTFRHPSQTTPVGFEPTRGDPIGLAGRRLSRSAKVSLHSVVAIATANTESLAQAARCGNKRGSGIQLHAPSALGSRRELRGFVLLDCPFGIAGGRGPGMCVPNCVSGALQVPASNCGGRALGLPTCSCGKRAPRMSLWI